MNFKRPRVNDVFNVSHLKGLMILIHPCPDDSHLREDKFKHFLDKLNPIGIYGFGYRNNESLLSPMPKIYYWKTKPSA